MVKEKGELADQAATVSLAWAKKRTHSAHRHNSVQPSHSPFDGPLTSLLPRSTVMQLAMIQIEPHASLFVTRSRPVR